jgi:hypothetical protein
LCEDLFSKQELISAGKLQFLGLNRIKRKLGKTWPGLQKIVYHEVEQAIAMYLLPTDIFIRYKDETYMIIFSEAGPEESQIKMRLIAEEIKRRLFAHEEKELRNIDVEESVAVIKSRDLREKSSLSERLEHIYVDVDNNKKDHLKLMERKAVAVKKKRSVGPPVSIAPTFEIDPYDNGVEKEKAVAEIVEKKINVKYVPLWDVRKNGLTTYLCLAQSDHEGMDAFDSHEALFRGLSDQDAITRDMEVLDLAYKELQTAKPDTRKLTIMCPVHYGTLARADSRREYILKCQQIPKEYKESLIFLLLNLPDDLPPNTIKMFSLPLKSHCNELFAQVDMDPLLNFSILRECGFDALGVRLKNSGGGERQIISDLETFSENAKKALIKKIFALDVKSFSLTTSAIGADIDYLGGSIIHDVVDRPDSVHRFMHQDLFSELVK